MAIERPTITASRFICTACQRKTQPSLSRRWFTTNGALNADAMSRLDASSAPAKRFTIRRGATPTPSPGSGSSVLDVFEKARGAGATWIDSGLDDSNITKGPYRLHVYATKHNTHITFVQPAKSAIETISSPVSSTTTSAADKKKIVDVLLSLSTGNIGFRKGGRGSYDAAYQLGAFTMKQIYEKGMLRDVREVEVVLRGFGAGREAVTKILLGTEGRLLRGRITAVMDATRLKIGGCRSPKPRRL